MTITAKQIKSGMTIKVSSIEDTTDRLLKSLEFDFFTDEQKNYIKYKLKNNITLSINKGSIKKDSPIIKVEDIKYITFPYITLLVMHTNIGKIIIKSSQKVELL